jgi:hypothetical protein
MPLAQRAYVIATCAIIGGAFAYAAAAWGEWPRLHYLPLSRELTFSSSVPPTSIVYPGLVLWGLGGTACGALAGAILVRIFPRSWADRTFHLFGAWAITAVVLAGSYYTWSLWPW